MTSHLSPNASQTSHPIPFRFHARGRRRTESLTASVRAGVQSQAVSSSRPDGRSMEETIARYLADQPPQLYRSGF